MVTRRKRIKLKAYDATVLHNVADNITKMCQGKNIECTKVPLPVKKRLFTIPKSTFIYKHSQQQLYQIERSILLTFIFKENQSLDMISSLLKIPASISVDIIADKS